MELEMSVSDQYAINNLERMMLECDTHIDVLYRLTELNRKAYNELGNEKLNLNVAIARYETDLACMLREVKIDYMSARRSESELAVLSPSARYKMHIEDSKGFFATIADNIAKFFKWIWDGLKSLFGGEAEKQTKDRIVKINVRLKEIEENKELLRDVLKNGKKNLKSNLRAEVVSLNNFLMELDDLRKAGMKIEDTGHAYKIPSTYAETIVDNEHFKSVLEGKEKEVTKAIGRVSGNGARLDAESSDVLKHAWADFYNFKLKKLYESKDEWIHRAMKKNKLIGRSHDGDMRAEVPVALDFRNTSIKYLGMFSDHASVETLTLVGNQVKNHVSKVMSLSGVDMLEVYDKMPPLLEKYTIEFENLQRDVNPKHFDEMEKAMTQLAKDAEKQYEAAMKGGFKTLFMTVIKLYQCSAKCAIESKKSLIHNVAAINHATELLLSNSKEIIKESKSSDAKDPTEKSS